MTKKFARYVSTTNQQYTVQRWQDNRFVQDSDLLAEEVPIALVYNGVSHMVMLATPQDLADFALGFSMTEGILQNISELYDIEIQQQEDGIELRLHIANERFAKLKERRRNMAGRTGCGLCGAESLQQVFKLPEDREANEAAITQLSMQNVFKAHKHLRSMQALQQLTGATHACAWADAEGKILEVREDVGRHNALDKLLGSLLMQNVQGGFILTSSRASYEMVQKVVMTKFEVLSAISAPTGLAVRLANAYGVTLLGFVREQQCVAYSDAHRLTD